LSSFLIRFFASIDSFVIVFSVFSVNFLTLIVPFVVVFIL
jgi:hypothetical protein